MLIFWVLMVGGVVWLDQSLARGMRTGSIPPQGESRLDLLKRPYARGEITPEQFAGMKRDLNL